MQQSWLFAGPLLATAAVASVFALRVRWLRPVQVFLLMGAIGFSGFCAFTLVKQGLSAAGMVAIEEAGVEVPLPSPLPSLTASQTNPSKAIVPGEWFDLPWAMGSSSGQAAIKVGAEPLPGKGVVFAATGEAPGSLALRVAGSMEGLDAPLDTSGTWCVSWQPGHTLSIGTRSFVLKQKALTSAASDKGLRAMFAKLEARFFGKQAPMSWEVSEQPGSSATPVKLDLTKVRYPRAWRLDEGVFLTRPPTNHEGSAGLWIIALHSLSNSATMTLTAPGSSTAVDLQPLQAATLTSSEGLLEATLWEPAEAAADDDGSGSGSQTDSDEPMLGRFSDVCRFQVITAGGKLRLLRLPGGGLKALPREDSIRLAKDFLHRQDVEHLVVSKWLYHHPDEALMLGTQPPPGGALEAQPQAISNFTQAASRMPGKQVCLTFDDGPSLEYTDRVLDLLKQYKAQATFFIVGNRLKGSTAQREGEARIIRRIVKEGHELGNHTMTHNGWGYWFNRLPTEVGATQQLIIDALKAEAGGLKLSPAEVAAATPRYFRPPYGAMGGRLGISRTAGKLAADYDFSTIMWSADPADWNKRHTPQQVANSSLSQLGDGGILLLHDIHGSTVQALTLILESLSRQKGIEFKTITAMRAAAQGGVAPPPPPRLPTTTGGRLASYLALPHLPADWLDNTLRLRHIRPEEQTEEPTETKPQGRADEALAAISLEVSGELATELLLGSSKLEALGKTEPLLRLPGRYAGALLLRVSPVEGDLAAQVAIVVATAVALLLAFLLGAARPWAAAVMTMVFAMSVTRFVLAVGAERVYPVADADLWKPLPWDAGLPVVPLLALFLPWLAAGLLPVLLKLGWWLCKPLRLIIGGITRWVGDRWEGFRRLTTKPMTSWPWPLAWALGVALLAAIWLIGGKERVFGVQKSIFYFPLLCLLTALLVGPGGWQLQSQRKSVVSWLRLMVAFVIMIAIHMGLAAVKGDLGGTLVAVPLGLLFLSYALSQPGWLWRGSIIGGLALIGWALWTTASTYLEALYLGEGSDWDFPLLARLALAAVALVAVPLLVEPTKWRWIKPVGMVVGAVLAAGILLAPMLPNVKQAMIAKALDENGQMDEEWYRKYLRFQPASVIREEGTKQAMTIFEELELVRIYRQTNDLTYGDGWLKLPIPKKRDNFLNDYCTSVFVQGQFGRLGAAALLAWAVGLFWLGASFTSSFHWDAAAALQSAAGKGACWIWASLTFIMVTSNLGLFPLTGKNAVLLGLNSGSDVLEATVLAVLAAWGAWAGGRSENELE